VFQINDIIIKSGQLHLRLPLHVVFLAEIWRWFSISLFFWFCLV